MLTILITATFTASAILAAYAIARTIAEYGGDAVRLINDNAKGYL